MYVTMTTLYLLFHNLHVQFWFFTHFDYLKLKKNRWFVNLNHPWHHPNAYKKIHTNRSNRLGGV